MGVIEGYAYATCRERDGQTTLSGTPERKTKMPTLREEAKAYVPPQTKNIADLESVHTEIELKNKTVNEGTKDEFSYKFIVVEGTEYRVPNSVIKQLKAQVSEKPDMTRFKVKKDGEGLNTEYTVVPLD